MTPKFATHRPIMGFSYSLVSLHMILEIAPLQVRAGQAPAFEAAFAKAQAIISAMPGYISHELQRWIEHRNQYVLLVRWRSLKDHEVGFRQSTEYQEWKQLLHHFYDPFPTVLHFEAVEGCVSKCAIGVSKE